MPVLRYASSVRARQKRVALRLNASHHLLVGQHRDAYLDLKKPLPASVDVYSHSDLTIAVSVVLDGRRLASEDVKQSVVMRHLVEIIRTNATLLSINNVSNAYIDGDDGQVKVNITPRRSAPNQNSSSQVALVSMHLTYHYKTVSDDMNASNAVKPKPTCSILNQVLDKFITYHFVKRYPLIFGPWGEKLEQESVYFPSIARSLFSMARRSPSEEFRSQVERHIKILRRRLKAAERDVSNDLQGCCHELDDEDGSPNSATKISTTDEDVVCLSMQRLFKLALRPTLVRGEPVSKKSLVLPPYGPVNEVTPGEAHKNIGANLHPILDDNANDWEEFCDDDEGLVCDMDESTTSDWAIEWSLTPTPPPSLATICSCAGSLSGRLSAGDDFTNDVFVLDDGTKVYTTEDQDTSTAFQRYLGDYAYDGLSRLRTEQHLEIYSDLSDSDSDSLLSLSFKEDNSHPIHHPPNNVNSVGTDPLTLSPGPESPLNDLTPTMRTEHDGSESVEPSTAEPDASADPVSCPEGIPSISSHSPFLRFSNVNHEHHVNYDVSLPSRLSVLFFDTNVQSFSLTSVSPVLVNDYALQDSLEGSSLRSRLSGTDLMAKPPMTPAFLSNVEKASACGLDHVDEEEDEFDLYSEWGDNEGGEINPTAVCSQDHHLSSDGTVGPVFYGRAGRSGDRPGSPERQEDEDLVMSCDDDGGFDFARSRGPMLYSPERLSEEGMVLDGEDEDCGWSAQTCRIYNMFT